MKTRHSLCSYTQNNSNVSAHTLQLIYITYIYIAKTRLNFCTSTDLCDAVNRLIFRFIRSIYMHRNYIHCKDVTQSLLIYIEQQQRLCACAATHIHHIHIHCKGTTQLLRTYTSVQRSKSINFGFSDQFTCVAITYIAKIQHSLCSYTQNDSNVFTHMLQLIYITHIHIAKAWLSFCTYTHLCNTVNWSISIFWLIYMRCNHIHCKDMTQSLLIYTEQQQRFCACAATHISHTHTYCKGMTQLLHTYTSVQRSKLINFDFLINLHALQIHKSKLI